MNALQKRLVDLAISQVGVLEFGGNNCGPQVQDYQTATWLAPGPWPWCAAFCCWLLKKALEDQDAREAVNVFPKQADSWRCRDASAYGWERWAKGKKLKILPETEKAKAGDFVIFDFSHIGIVVEDQTGNTISTVEGNTNGKGERDSESGDGVWRKTRAATLTKCYVRMEVANA